MQMQMVLFLGQLQIQIQLTVHMQLLRFQVLRQLIQMLSALLGQSQKLQQLQCHMMEHMLL